MPAKLAEWLAIKLRKGQANLVVFLYNSYMSEASSHNVLPAWGLLAAGGSGTRYGEERNKLLEPLLDRLVLERSLSALLDADKLSGVVVVGDGRKLRGYQSRLSQVLERKDKPVLWAKGGQTRRESVWAGLQVLPDEVNSVVVHDAARPLLQGAWVDMALEELIREPGAHGCLLGHPVIDTLKAVEPVTRCSLHSGLHTATIKNTADRSLLWAVQTPQVFLKETLIQAHQAVGKNALVTDDAQLLELAGLGPVLIKECPGHNVKLTTLRDLPLLEALMRQQLEEAENN